MNKKIRTGILLCFIMLLIVLIKFIFRQNFTSVEDLQNYMKRFGIIAPIILILVQAFQVVIPVLPGYLGCAAGAVAFGSTIGFWCNYIGISMGSVIAYFLARRYGIGIVLTLFSEKRYKKLSDRIEKSKSYERFLFIATLLPFFPDDFLCYFSGLIRMNSKRFIGIIILGKPWCILAYSILFGLVR